MTRVKDQTIGDYLQALGSTAAVPGGGSAAALAAATRGLALAAEASRNAWDMTASDLSAGSELLQTGRDGALANVAINLPELRGEPAVRIERAYRELMAKA